MIGDNGAGKSTLIKCLSGAQSPDAGDISRWREVDFTRANDARDARHRDGVPDPCGGSRARHRQQPVPGPGDAQSGFLGSVFRMLDGAACAGGASPDDSPRHRHAAEHGAGGRDAVRRSAAGRGGRPGRRLRQQVIILDEPTAALGVRESARVLKLIENLRDRGCRSSSSRTTCRRCSRWPTGSTSSGWASAPQ